MNEKRGTDDLAGALMAIMEEFGDIFHEWKGPRAAKFLKASGISERNWRIFMRRLGLADGNVWTFQALAEAEKNIICAEKNITRVRAYQIVDQTKKNFERFLAKMVRRGSQRSGQGFGDMLY